MKKEFEIIESKQEYLNFYGADLQSLDYLISNFHMFETSDLNSRLNYLTLVHDTVHNYPNFKYVVAEIAIIKDNLNRRR